MPLNSSICHHPHNQPTSKTHELKTSLDMRRKRLILRAKQRSTREVNLILSSFITTVLPSLEEKDILHAEHLLDAEDNELYRWVLDPAFAPKMYHILLQAIRKSLPFPLSRHPQRDG